MTLLEEANDLLDDCVWLRRRVHRHPEIGLDLPATQRAILDFLGDTVTDVRLGEGCTSVTAIVEGAHPGPTVLLRGDMDALPMPEDTGLDFASEVDGAMHACGHDSHVAMLATAAKLLHRHREEIHGRVLLMFQPGEEGYFGAKVMIDEGLLDGENAPAAAFAIHIAANERAGLVQTRPGALAASADRVHVKVIGKGGHASAPWRSLDPIPAACEMALAFQTMVTRSIDVFDPSVVTVGKIAAGTTDNVIPEEAILEATVRALTPETREKVLANMRRVVEGVASAHGVRSEVEVDLGYPPTINDAEMATFAEQVARDVLGEENVEPMEHPVMGAEDFSYVLERVPGAMVRLGVAPPDVDEPASNHSNRMLLHEPAMASGIAFHAAVALRFLDGSR